MKLKRMALAGPLFALLLAQGALQSWGADEAALRAEGKRMIAGAAGTLSTNLMKAITNGGFTNAIAFCSVHAQPLTEAASIHAGGAVLRRISLKTRNPANNPDEIDRGVMEEYLAQIATGVPLAPQVKSLPRETRYYEPIVIQNPLCLNCHGQPGEQIKPDTLELVRKLYPKDAATGYKMNDLRGVWSVTFPELASPPRAR